MVLYYQRGLMSFSQVLPILLAREGPLNGKQWMLNNPLVIGRETHCDIVINDRQVSRFHARLTPTPDGIILEDMGSKNGTVCNGSEVNNPKVLKDGDIIQVSLVQQFIFFSSDATMPLLSTSDLGNRLKLDERSRRVWVNNIQINPSLSAQQFQLLLILYERSGQVVTRQELIDMVWSEVQAAGVSDQAVDALIRRLRDRLAEIDKSHAFIVTVRGHGIRLDNPKQ